MKKFISTKAIVPVVLVSLLIVFIVTITKYSSPVNKAVEEIVLCNSKDSVEVIFNKHKQNLTITNRNLEKTIDQDFLQEVRKKLSSLNLPEEEIKECNKWLPPLPTSLNLIVVPDLSKRIVDEMNNPDQIKNDTILLSHIWKAFEVYAKQSVSTKHRLVIDLTDEKQAEGQFKNWADSLVFELPEHNAKNLRTNWFRDTVTNVSNRYSKSIDSLYSFGKNSPLGADYWKYFRRDLSKHIKKTTLFDNYRNVLIIITDGYLESEDKLYTGSWNERNSIAKKIKKGIPIEELIPETLKFPDITQKFPTLEVLILEVNERKQKSKQEPNDYGTTEDYDILKFLWTDWFKRLEVKNVGDDFFILRSEATRHTKNKIDEFLAKETNI